MKTLSLKNVSFHYEDNQKKAIEYLRNKKKFIKFYNWSSVQEKQQL